VDHLRRAGDKIVVMFGSGPSGRAPVAGLSLDISGFVDHDACGHSRASSMDKPAPMIYSSSGQVTAIVAL